MTITEFLQKKKQGVKITLVTCYDATLASLFADCGIDALLVGDSAAMVIHGHETTLAASTELMALHVAAVKRGNPDAFIIADMPFLSFRQGKSHATAAAGQLMQAGARAVKLEGIDGHEDVIDHLVGSGIPVMGHLGLTPQYYHQLGGYKVQGRDESAADRIREQALKLQASGCFSLVLECVPEVLAGEISQMLEIPVIGIGAGRETDGQVLVLYDLLGLGNYRKPRFARAFMDGNNLVKQALTQYGVAVRQGLYPSEGEVYNK
jgi:3-methyl-2-oxobutanoate hydroxymethyltransferase